MSKYTAKTQNQSHFARAVHANVPRSVFLRNSTKKTTFDCGRLIPIYCDEVIPGDTFDMDMAFVSRLATPIFPTMDILNLDFYAFFVPNRLVWDGWEELMGENKKGAWVPTVDPALVPVFDLVGEVQSGSLGDYYGLPVGLRVDWNPVSALPFRAYALIWNEWFRDQNMQAPLPINTGNIEDVTGLGYSPFANNPFFVNKKHDYFTSCLPAPQKGESSLIPIELNELIPIITGATGVTGEQAPLKFTYQNGTSVIRSANLAVSSFDGGRVVESAVNIATGDGGFYPNNIWGDARGMQINATTISELRTAFQIQKLYERDARGGTRYVEMLKAHFGVDAEDYRLQRPEFLGHMHSYVGMQQVPQTSQTTKDTVDPLNSSPQGTLAAFSHTMGRGGLFKKSFTEHGFIHIFAVARHPKTYQQGLEKFWFKRDRLDFYMPVLAHISEQPVYNKEIYALSNDPAYRDGIFGYNEAWADYRYKPNQVTGQFREGILTSLKEWHYADYYTSPPYLSDQWMRDNSADNVERTLAVKRDKQNQIIMDIAFLCKATRPMPVHSIPGLVDHF